MKIPDDHESIKIVDKYRKAAGRVCPDYHYKGLAIHARAGLHEYIAERILNTLQPGATILDLGAGSGAMSLRLHDLGFQVTAADIVAESFALHARIPFKLLDLNTSFSQEFNGLVDGIVAIEIIEHLENPRKFLRQCLKIIKPGGALLITTPNVDNPVSKALFVRGGYFMWFNDFNYEIEGHITPLTQWQLDKMIHESGLNVLSLTTFGNPYTGVKRGRNKLYILARLIQATCNKQKPMLGEILVAILGIPNIL